MGVVVKGIEEIEDSWVEKIQKEIDRELLEIVKMTSDGWVSIPYDTRDLTYEKFKEIAEWMDKHRNGPIEMKNGRWWFKDPNDKVLFLLRWSEWL